VKFTRRDTLILAASAAMASYYGLGTAQAQEGTTKDVAKLAAVAVPDHALGSDAAPVTVIEYASPTCPHCAAFHNETFGLLQTNYIDTGKVRFIMREFPLDPLATAGFMLARCNGNDKYVPMTDLLFAQQRNWAFTDKPVDALSSLVKQAGFTQESFEACLKRQDIYDAVTVVKDGGAKAGVDSTPTFFINGQKRSGALTIAEFDKILEPLLGN